MSAKIDWEPSKENFDALLPFIEDPLVTDIDLNADMSTGHTNVWIRHLERGMESLPSDFVTIRFVEQFANLIANRVNKSFNPQHVCLEADTRALRISILHESVTATGRCICIRKSPPILRHSEETLIQSGFIKKEALQLLIRCVEQKMNMVICGVPGAGKTEFLKFLTQYIKERVTTIEDNPEIHFSQINPNANCVAIRVVPGILDYSLAIQKALRYDTEWILLSEARGREAKELLEAWSTGTHGITTIHANDVRKVPDRILSMLDEESKALERKIYSFLNVAVQIRKKRKPDGTDFRYVDQIAFFARENGENRIVCVMDEGEFTKEQIPKEIARQLRLSVMKEELDEKGRHEAFASGKAQKTN